MLVEISLGSKQPCGMRNDEMNEINDQVQSSTTQKKPELIGVVTKTNNQKTIKVTIEMHVKHRKYGKYQKRSSVVHAHDESNSCKEGDLVRIFACKRYYKSKTWVVESILK
jgi:small subunit ribosomal protein S17